MTISHPLRSVIVDFSPSDESIRICAVKRELVETTIAQALHFPMFFDEEAARSGSNFVLDDEFARRLGAGILSALALSYPELKATLNLSGPMAREIGPPLA